MTTGKKKFGAFGGVFTPSILTILGVIMYLRLGWVVGNAGLWGSIFIVLLAHVISVTTGLSISSIATDKKVGAGGVYYVLSRSLGLPIGGAIGLTLFIGTALSIALYIVGFSESFNGIIGLESSIDNIRLTGSIALLLLTIIAFISTSLAIKTQYFILAAIFISLASIFLGGSFEASEAVTTLPQTTSAPFETVFAIFFPAVTGFTAGIAMSGDLKDPKRAIPVGTIAAISVGFVVYIGLSVFLFFKVDATSLKTDYNILEKIALFGPVVIAGIWGATLSSALGGILGGPRILQAMSLDKITPRFFSKEQGKTKEPRIALIVAILLAEGGILIGDLDIVARVVSMFYLAAYGFINISFFLESWASADFRPSFKVNKWFGFIGFLATFGVMFQLDMLAMFLALIIIGGIYLWLTRREIALGTGDIWRSVWSTSVKEGLKRLEQKEDHKRNWKPNILLFSGNSEARPHLIEFSQALSGRAGLVTNFDLIENEGMDVLFTKHKQSVKDELLQKYGIFGRRIDVKNVYKGIETIAATFGFSGIDPNTVLMGWARNTKDPIWFAQMTQKLIDLDYNVLYMDYDQARGFGKREQIDLWWRGISNNAELMLQVAKFISFNADWRKARIRILLVNDYNVDRRIIESRISTLLDEFRLKAEIKVIDNHLEKKSFYHILKIHSLKSDLVFIGIPNIIEGKEQDFVQKTNDLVAIIGTTLLVKGSTTFDVTQLGLKDMAHQEVIPEGVNWKLPEIKLSGQELLDKEIHTLDNTLGRVSENLKESCLTLLAQQYVDFTGHIEEVINDYNTQLKDQPADENTDIDPVKKLVELSRQFADDTLPLLSEILQQGIQSYTEERIDVLSGRPASLDLSLTSDGKERRFSVRWRKGLIDLDREDFPPAFVRALKEFGIVAVGVVNRSKEMIKTLISDLLCEERKPIDAKKFSHSLEEVRTFASQMIHNTLLDIRYADRKLLNKLSEKALSNSLGNPWSRELFHGNPSSKKEIREFIENYSVFWQRNMLLFHHRFETAIELKRTSVILECVTGQLFQRLKKRSLDKLMDSIQSILNAPDKKEAGFNGLLPPMYDFLPDYRVLNKEIGKALKNLPAGVEMMDTNSEINMQDNQGKDIATVNFSVDKIAEYLIETRFVAFVHENLETFAREINAVIGELNVLVGDWINAKEDVKDDIELSEMESALLRIREKAQDALDICESEINERLNHVLSLLSVQHIIDESDQLKQYIRKIEIQKGLQGPIRQQIANLKKRSQKMLQFVEKRLEDQKHRALPIPSREILDSLDHIRNFYEKSTLAPRIRESIPYYYRQLFSGKHLQSQSSASFRDTEIDQVIKAIVQTKNGATGGIMITGPAFYGKSFLTEKIVNQYIKGKVYYIRPPQGGGTSTTDLDIAFSSATGQRGQIKAILDGFEEKSIFVFSDLELWWLSHPGGHRIIDYLVSTLIESGKDHSFIFNADQYALGQIKKTTRLNEILLATIPLRPFTKQSMRSEILKRHKTGGLDLFFKGRLITPNRVDRHFDVLFEQIHQLAKGNIGLALQIWLRSITMDEKGMFILQKPEPVQFPEISDPMWQNILLQLILHNALSVERFKLLYEDMPDNWITARLNELKNTRLLESRDGMELRLNNQSRLYIQEWLVKTHIL